MTAIDTQRRYWLTPHAHICACAEQVILLDAFKDQYFALEEVTAHALSILVHGWPQSASSLITLDLDPEDAQQEVQKLLSCGILTSHQEGGKPASAPEVARPTGSALDDHPAASPAYGWRHWQALLIASLGAQVSLKWKPLAHVLSRMAAAKRIRNVTQLSSTTALRDLVAIFYALRPYIFTSRNYCLLDSLTLMRFLARFSIYPDWVFGVRVAPFAAHCWLQYGGYVLNDTAENVQSYTPIMVV